MSESLPLVVGLGAVDPGLVAEVFTGRCRFVADPSDADLRKAQVAIVRADATIDAAFLDRAPPLRLVARGEIIHSERAAVGPLAAVANPGWHHTGRAGRSPVGGATR